MNTFGRPRSAGIAIAATACLIAGCGGGGSSKLTKAELVSKESAACKTVAAGLRGLGDRPSDFATNPTSAAKYLDKLKAIIDKFDARTKSLVPPDSAKADWNHLVSLLNQATTLLDSADKKAHAKDPSGIQDFNKSNGYGPQLQAAAKKIGVSSCFA
jgi:hypothetical protein